MGLDLTLRDVQSKLKEKSLPWALSKSFRSSAPISEIIPYEEFVSDRYLFTMELNGEVRQKGDTNYMMYSIPFLISYLSKRFTLQKGDCIMTGTPGGVGQLNNGDKIKIQLEDKIKWELEVL
jgi:2-keto-4-pentenoate hydratase/2-oxohepta-3-ene-1,7-dioic acid hydratase in catechol pathway